MAAIGNYENGEVVVRSANLDELTQVKADVQTDYPDAVFIDEQLADGSYRSVVSGY